MIIGDMHSYSEYNNYKRNSFNEQHPFYIEFDYKHNAIVFIIDFCFKLIGCFIARNKGYNIMKS